MSTMSGTSVVWTLHYAAHVLSIHLSYYAWTIAIQYLGLLLIAVINSLQSVMYAGACLVLQLLPKSLVTDLMSSELHWLSVTAWVHFKALHGLALNYLADLNIPLTPNPTRINFRSTSSHQMFIQTRHKKCVVSVPSCILVNIYGIHYHQLWGTISFWKQVKAYDLPATCALKVNINSL